MARTASSTDNSGRSVRRAVRLLRVVAAGQDQGARLKDIVSGAGINRPSAHRILRILVEEGAVEQDLSTRRYMIGQEVSLLGLARIARFPLKSIAEPYLRQIAKQSGETAFLTIRNRYDSICVDRKTGDYPIKVLAVDVGARRPLGVGVAGVALLACMAENEALEIVKANEPRYRQYQTTAARLMEQVRAARTRGYAFSESGLVRGTRSLALAVCGHGRDVAGAISVSAITGRFPPSRLPVLVAQIRTQCDLISRRIAALERSSRRANRRYDPDHDA